MASKLPKPSGLRMPQIARPMPRIRRSQSFADIRSERLAVPSRCPVLTTINQNTEALPSKPTSAPKEKVMATTSKAATASKTTVKRPGGKKEEAPKAKVARQGKVPDWDYKTRFQLLNDKYKLVQNAKTDLEMKLSGLSDIDQKYTMLESNHEQLRNEYNIFKAKSEDLTIKNQTLEKINSDLKQQYSSTLNELNILKTEHAARVSAYDQLKVRSEDVLNQVKHLEESLSMEISCKNNLLSKMNTLQNDLYENNTKIRILHNTIQELKGNIRVFCRVRPPIENEEGLICNINCDGDTCIEIRKSKESINAITGRSTDCRAEFTFDKVFGPESTQDDIFEELSQLVQSALDGYDVCVFAYGQTGSGKTYTMQGLDTPEHIGMIPRAINLIFDKMDELRKFNWEYKVKASFLEIYNEMVRDLLVPDITQNLEIKYNSGKGTTVSNLSIIDVRSADELKQLMAQAHHNRKVAATNFNEYSSRSHAITKIYLHGVNKPANVECVGLINLVDLAGSENAKASPGGERLAETKHINKSLSTLGAVMLSLWNKEKHIPYRNSKLTYLLQSSLGGTSKTLMVVNISPFEENYFESLNSLRFASKVKEVKTVVSKNRSKTNSVSVLQI